MERDGVNTYNSGEWFALRSGEGEPNRETFVGWGWVGLGFFVYFLSSADTTLGKHPTGTKLYGQ